MKRQGPVCTVCHPPLRPPLLPGTSPPAEVRLVTRSPQVGRSACSTSMAILECGGDRAVTARVIGSVADLCSKPCWKPAARLPRCPRNARRGYAPNGIHRKRPCRGTEQRNERAAIHSMTYQTDDVRYSSGLRCGCQQAGRLTTLGYLGPGPPEPDTQRVNALVSRLRELGWIEGRNLAIGALMTSSNLLDCTTGKSAGFAPLRMRPT